MELLVPTTITVPVFVRELLADFKRGTMTYGDVILDLIDRVSLASIAAGYVDSHRRRRLALNPESIAEARSMMRRRMKPPR